ncbi:MAG: ORF6N domain-containing protein [Bacteroidales bacterium]|nr:ORF6N domain-containing protein [Bacteroidales bacterium]
MSISSNELFRQEIENRIFMIRGKQVMLDMHLAELYNVEVKVLNQAVKRNPDRFPDTYFFQLSETEWEFLRSQFVTLKKQGKKAAGSTRNARNRGRHPRICPMLLPSPGVAFMLSGYSASETPLLVAPAPLLKCRSSFQANPTFPAMDFLEANQPRTAGNSAPGRALGKRAKAPAFSSALIFDIHIYLFLTPVRSTKHSIILFDNYSRITIGNRKLALSTRPNKTIMLASKKHNQHYAVEFDWNSQTVLLIEMVLSPGHPSIGQKDEFNAKRTFGKT